MALIPTTCGELTPQTYEIIKFNGGPDIQQGHIPFFHQMMCQWAYNMAQQWSFVVVIEAQNKEYLLGRIKNTFPQLEPPGWNVTPIVDDTWRRDTQEVVGCIFAGGVRIPGESTNIDRAGITEGSRRGFINAPIINGRADFNNIEIGFNETNQSFVDGVLRPWSIIAQHDGLLARRQNESIKANVAIYQLARAQKNDEPRPNIVRKHWTFKDCVPVNVADEDIAYGNTNDYGKRQVQFVFNTYNMVGTKFQ